MIVPRVTKTARTFGLLLFGPLSFQLAKYNMAVIPVCGCKKMIFWIGQVFDITDKNQGECFLDIWNVGRQ